MVSLPKLDCNTRPTYNTIQTRENVNCFSICQDFRALVMQCIVSSSVNISPCLTILAAVQQYSQLDSSRTRKGQRRVASNLWKRILNYNQCII